MKRRILSVPFADAGVLAASEIGDVQNLVISKI